MTEIRYTGDNTLAALVSQLKADFVQKGSAVTSVNGVIPDSDGAITTASGQNKLVFVRPYTGANSSSNSVTATGYGADASSRIGYEYSYLINDNTTYTYGSAVLSNDYATFAAEHPVVDVWLYTDQDMSIAFRTANSGAQWGGTVSGQAVKMIETRYYHLRAGAANRVRIDFTSPAYTAIYENEANAQGVGVFVIASGENIPDANAAGTYKVLLFATDGEYTASMSDAMIVRADHAEVAETLSGFDPNDYYKAEDIDTLLCIDKYITCWGDSLTAQAGWTDILAERAEIPLYNGGTGGETVRTICARQGADVMLVNNVTIPASGTVTLATYAEGGFDTALGHKATPLLQGSGANVNPVEIGGVKGTLAWTGSSYNDSTGTWTFTRTTAGADLIIDCPTPMTTAYDRERNAPKLMILFMGQNGGYDDLDELVRMHRLCIAHSRAVKTLILGLSSGTAADRAEYETRMQQEFGRYFISLRAYLCQYGLEDAGLTPTAEDESAMAEGRVPPQLLADSVHYTDVCKHVIGEMLYKYCKTLGILGAASTAGLAGEDGVSIVDVYVQSSGVGSGAANVVAVALSNGETKTFNIYNGDTGPQGAMGYSVFRYNGTVGTTPNPDGFYEIESIPGLEDIAAGHCLLDNAGNLFHIALNANGYHLADSYIALKGATGPQGKSGADGVGIASVSQTTASTDDGGENIVTVTKTDNTTSTFSVYNGKKGDTPVKGTDYFTPADKSEMVASVKAALPTFTLTGTDVDDVVHTWTLYGEYDLGEGWA